MRRGVHPGNVQGGNIGGLGDVFRDQAEAGAGHPQTRLQISFAIEAVRERVVCANK